MLAGSAGNSRDCKAKATWEKAFTIILLSKEAPDLVGSLLRGVLVVWQVLGVLGIDHLEYRLQGSKRNGGQKEQRRLQPWDGAQVPGPAGLSIRAPGRAPVFLGPSAGWGAWGRGGKAFASYLSLSVLFAFPDHADI